jgi:hypothetical protein
LRAGTTKQSIRQSATASRLAVTEACPAATLNHLSRDEEKTSPDGNYFYRDGRHFRRNKRRTNIIRSKH